MKKARFRHTPKAYSARLDSKKRIVLRNAEYEYYEVEERENGSFVLKPKVLVDPDSISLGTLKMMDRSIRNLKAGKVSSPIDLSEFKPKKRTTAQRRVKK
jgi:hypothetical protein